MSTTARKTSRPALRVEECAWESGKLGRDEAHVRVADPTEEAALDDALGLQLISIRLQGALIKDMKLIADYHGIGYQPLMRDVLNRFARAELHTIAENMAKTEAARKTLAQRPKRKHA
ncbi:MAG TPA: hypothetical protein PKW99_14755 [Thauera sp.]|nr:hypothetical protein [Thauera sp.]